MGWHLNTYINIFPAKTVTANLKHTPLRLSIYIPNWKLSVKFQWLQLKTFGYQKVIFIQRMDMLRQQLIFRRISTFKNLLKKNFLKNLFFKETKIETSWEQTKNKQHKRTIPIRLITFVHLIYIYIYIYIYICVCMCVCVCEYVCVCARVCVCVKK